MCKSEREECKNTAVKWEMNQAAEAKKPAREK